MVLGKGGGAIADFGIEIELRESLREKTHAEVFEVAFFKGEIMTGLVGFETEFPK